MGTGLGLKLVLVSMSPISKSYRGFDPLNRNVAGSGDSGHHQCGLIFPPVATVGSPAVAVCDAVPGRTHPVEGIVTY